jgi:EAL domain-containing protein (putative c-di-GMP-specific phosphodiesterase class I)
LRNLIKDFRFECSGNRFKLTSSIGVVPIDAQYTTPEHVLQAADAACHSAKEMGRDRIYVYSADDKEQIQRRGDMNWAMRVRRALEDRRLRLVTQPIIPITGPNLGSHYEVLLRMVDEKGEMLPTANFMPAAERYGLSTELDMWTVNTIYDWLSQRQVHVRNLHLCTINLSGHSLGNVEFHKFLMQKCIQSQVPLDKLCFEITETAAITNLANATRLMRTLKRAGCSFALDDFGSGLSSFAYLKDLPVDYLKIDGVFVRGIAADPLELALLKSINDLGHMLGKKTVAEFVENQEVLGKLHEIGVDYAQGFGIGRPQPLEKIA